MCHTETLNWLQFWSNPLVATPIVWWSPALIQTILFWMRIYLLSPTLLKLLILQIVLLLMMIQGWRQSFSLNVKLEGLLLSWIKLISIFKFFQRLIHRSKMKVLLINQKKYAKKRKYRWERVICLYQYSKPSKHKRWTPMMTIFRKDWSRASIWWGSYFKVTRSWEKNSSNAIILLMKKMYKFLS